MGSSGWEVRGLGQSENCFRNFYSDPDPGWGLNAPGYPIGHRALLDK